MTALPRLGVIVVTFASADVIEACLSGLLSSNGVSLSVVVVDNASPDATLDKVAQIPARGPHQITVLESGANAGFAAGVNLGLRHLLEDDTIDRFWVLNPDTVPHPDTAQRFALHPAPDGFAMIGGRVLYADPPHPIQIDGGTINRRTGITGNINLGQPANSQPPDPDSIDFVTGASLVVSRTFAKSAGPMPEDYFLYYEEVDWALRRGNLPLLHCPEAIVHHKAGTAIGSPTLGRGASVFSLWFKHRARLRFVRRHYPASLPTALAYSVAKAGQHLLRGQAGAAWAILSGSLNLPPPNSVAERLRTARFTR